MGFGERTITSVDIRVGQVRPGITLSSKQQLKQFAYTPTDQVSQPYLIPWVKAVIASGDSVHLIDIDTGLATPYTVPKGYGLSIIQESFTFNQDSEAWLYFDSLLISCPGILTGGIPTGTSQVLGYSTLTLDPTASSSHTADLVIFNRGLADMKGGINIIAVLEAFGTPPFPTEKDTQCPFCATINMVNVAMTTIVCKKCGKTYVVFNMAGRR